MPTDPGVHGRITDPTGLAVGSGQVVLVPASAVADLAEAAIDFALSPAEAAQFIGDEPLEDVIDSQADRLPRAAVDADGRYRFEQVPEGDHFLVWLPDPDDLHHLPGGDAARAALARDSLAGTQRDLRVSGRPGPDATYVGSSGCLTCHGRHRIARTAHSVGLSRPGVRGGLQDGSHFARLDELFERFEQGTTLYFSDCVAGAAEPTRQCKVTDVEPAASAVVSFVAELARDPLRLPGEDGAFSVTLRNRLAGGEATYPVALAYGGALTRQQLLTRLPRAGGAFTHQLLPFAFQLGGDLRAADAADWPLAAYYPERWYDFGASTLREPEAAAAFDNQCAGCHYTGFQLAGSAGAGFTAGAAPNPDGAYDTDGDGRHDEINVGCESCHGPGSEHLEQAVRGARIVSPSLLTPERALLLCGRCHSRPLGIESTRSQAPLDASGAMPPPGLRRSEYLRDYVSRIDAAESDVWPSGDSRSHHQQYTDLLRSPKHRNPRLPMVCESCHDPHGSDQPHDLVRPASDNRICTECHAEELFTDVRMHVQRATGNPHEGSTVDELTCGACHMVDTALSGARRFALNDIFPGDARLQYMHGDVSSHRFGPIDRDQAGMQPTAFTQACAVCHGTLLPNP